MGRIAKLISFFRSDKNGLSISEAIINPGGDANITTEHFSDIGDDSHPLEGDYVIAVDIPGTGRMSAVGYYDQVNKPKAMPGEKRIYARKENTGVQVSEVWLQNDGSIRISNDNGNIEMKPNGDINLNGLIIKANGELESQKNIITKGDVIADTISLKTHEHPILSGSSAPGPTGVPLP